VFILVRKGNRIARNIRQSWPFFRELFDGIVTALSPGEGRPGEHPAHAILMTMLLLPYVAVLHAVDPAALDLLIQA